MPVLNRPNPTDIGPLSRKVLEYCDTFESIMAKGQDSGFSADAWDELGALVDQDNFVRVGSYLEVMNWPQYVDVLTKFAGHMSWEGVFHRVTEVPGRVFLELEERTTAGGHTNVVNTVTVYDFNEAGKLKDLGIYVAGVPIPSDFDEPVAA